MPAFFQDYRTHLAAFSARIPKGTEDYRGAWDKKNLPLRFLGLPVDLSPVAEPDDEDNKGIIPQVAYQAIVPYTITPKTCKRLSLIHI